MAWGAVGVTLSKSRSQEVISEILFVISQNDRFNS